MKTSLEDFLKNPSWICSKEQEGFTSQIFEKEFTSSSLPKEAMAFVGVLGVYALFVNDKRVLQGILEPGITSKKRVLGQSYDLLPYLQKGTNTLRVELAEGWAIGDYGDVHAPRHNHYLGDHLSLAFYLSLGEKSIQSDSSWECYEGFHKSSGIYYGEDVDLTQKKKSLGKALMDLSAHPKLEEGKVWLSEHEHFPALRYFVTPKGEQVIDFGQNLAGYPRIKMVGKRGEELAFDFAETLDKEGNFYRANYRSARSEFHVVSLGNGEEIQPSFSYFGYRYLRLLSYPQEVHLEDFVSIAIYSEMTPRMTFSSSNPLLVKLFQNVFWSQKSNFVSIPTDCPQRDERLGWTGDAEIFAPTALLNADCKDFYLSYLQDVCLEQAEDGAIPDVVPNVLCYTPLSSAGWGDVITLLPNDLYEATGDLKAFQIALPSMKKWVRYIQQSSPEKYLWLDHPHFGDWLALDGGEANFGLTQRDFTASLYYYESAFLVEKAMALLGDKDPEFVGLSAAIRKEFRKKFLVHGLPSLYYHNEESKKGRIEAALTQTSLSEALYFKMYEGEEERLTLAKALHEKLVADGLKLKTGFLGTVSILYALAENGYAEDAYSLLLNEKDPGWLYSILKGATTVWESYDGILPNGDFKDPGMNSFNHYSHGAVMGWIYQDALGIRCLEAGYKKILFAPHPDLRVKWMEAHFESPVGKISSRYEVKDGGIEYVFESPSVSEAVISKKHYPLHVGKSVLFLKN
jgi:alpha-L-rhamnosidase